MFEMEKAQRVSLTMQVEANLKGALIVGVLKPGARLVTKEIAGQLGTSVTPVREALLRLVAAGALDATPAQAFLVPNISLAQYQEITLIRKHLEGLAVAQASGQMNAKKLANLKSLNKAFMAAKLEQNTEQALQANREFRFALYEYADMPTLTSLIEQLWVQIGPCLTTFIRSRPRWRKGIITMMSCCSGWQQGTRHAASPPFIRLSTTVPLFWNNTIFRSSSNVANEIKNGPALRMPVVFSD